jgi:quercetin dioxygenase-like cupin family protein
METVNVLGPTVEILTPPGDDDAPCAMRGAIPAGGIVPLHSHPEPETFIVISGDVEGLVHTGDDLRWIPLGAGDVLHVPGDARHAWRNRSARPAVSVVVTVQRIARFFREVATAGGPPSEEEVRHFLEVADRFGYWNATPEENAGRGSRARDMSRPGYRARAPCRTSKSPV